MKVALVNTNPAVSRLATLSLSKIGCEYIEVASLDMLDSGLFDVLIIDSDVQIDGTNLKDLADKILYLASKNSPELSGADRVLFKPFLPTEFVSIMEKLSPQEERVEEEKFEDLEDLTQPLEESKFIDELNDEIFDDSLPEITELKDDEFKLDDMEFAHESDENAFDELKIEDNNLTQELSELVKSIDDMPKELVQDENLNEDDDAMKAEMLAREEELLKEFGFDSEALEQEDASETEAEQGEEKIDELMSELASSAYDEELDVIESIKSDIDEIENLDAKFEEELKEATKDFVAKEKFEEEVIKDDEENFAEELELPDELTGEFDDEKFEIQDEAKFEIEEHDLSTVTNDEVAIEAESKDVEIYEYEAASYDDIEQISEAQMKRALEESTDEVVPKKGDADIKTELTNKISEQIATSLSVSSIKDALKGMNIKINITFEEK